MIGFHISGYREIYPDNTEVYIVINLSISDT